MKYRKLEDHETVQTGDRYGHALEDGNVTHDHVDGRNYAGRKQADWSGLHNGWYRPIQESNWISFKDRQPTEDDTYKHDYSVRAGQIVVRRVDGTIPMFLKLHQIQPEHTHWMSLNFVGPEAPAPIKVDGRDLLPQKNGDVKISCGTVIPSKDVEELFRQRAEAMKS